MSTIVSIADAIVASLNAQVFTPSITAVRAHIPIFDLAQVGTDIKVNVVPRSLTIANAARTLNFFDVSIDIGVQQRVDPNDPAQIDILHDLVEQIDDHLRLKQLDTMMDAQWISTDHDPILAADHLEKLNVFTSVLTLTYRLTR